VSGGVWTVKAYAPRIHYAPAHGYYGHSICGGVWVSTASTEDPSEVTCEQCLELMARDVVRILEVGPK
jgi:hypothetical protein